MNADGSYTVPGVPSGTFALAFLGCSGGNPTPTVTDPASPGISYHAVWWNGVPLSLDQNSNGGPDPIAQGANLVTVTPGQTLTGYDWCFGCTAISIATITPGTGSLTTTFTTPGLVDDTSDTQDVGSARAIALTYTATCTASVGGTSGSAEGTSSAITVTGLAPGAYTCTVTAANDGVNVASSAVSELVEVPASATAPTASPTGPTPAAAGTNPEPNALAFTGTNSTRTLVPLSSSSSPSVSAASSLLGDAADRTRPVPDQDVEAARGGRLPAARMLVRHGSSAS